MKNYMLLLVAVVSALFLAGCSGNSSSSTANPYVGGTSGLLVSFIENAPPSMVTDSASPFPFNVIVRLQNVGETDIVAGKATVSIAGLNPADFGSNPAVSASTTEAITGAKKDFAGNSIPGVETQITLPSDATQYQFNRVLTGGMEIPLMASVCYLYQTRASGTYCIKKDIVSNVPGVCEPNGAQSLYSSGAPIQITSLMESTAGQNTVMLTFTIAHRANGYVFTDAPTGTPATACNEGRISDQNKVKVTIKTSGATPQCFGLTNGYAILGSSGQTSVSCRLTGLPPVDSVGSIEIQLDYYYLEKKSPGTLLVRHVQ
jgi:hypothetical protein